MTSPGTRSQPSITARRGSWRTNQDGYYRGRPNHFAWPPVYKCAKLKAAKLNAMVALRIHSLLGSQRMRMRAETSGLKRRKAATTPAPWPSGTDFGSHL